MNLAESMKRRSSAQSENLRINTWKKIVDGVARTADEGKRVYVFSTAGVPEEVLKYVKQRAHDEGFSIEWTGFYLTLKW